MYKYVFWSRKKIVSKAKYRPQRPLKVKNFRCFPVNLLHMVAYIHQVDAIYQFSAAKTAENDSYKNIDFIEAKIVILAPFDRHKSIFPLIMVVKNFGPFHSYMRPWIGAILREILV